MSGLGRFQHLERPRVEGAAEEQPRPQRSRFDAVEVPGAGAATRLPDPPPARRGEGEPEAPRSTGVTAHTREREASGLELEADDGAQPFRRCCRCEVESGRFAATCPACGADLHTDEQRIFNERLWAERQREAAAEERENAARREAARRSEAEGAAARRAAAEVLAREVGEKERRRLEAEGWPRGEDGDGGGRPWGVQLLGLIRDPRWRVGVIAAVLAAIAIAVVWALSRRDPRAILVVALVVSILFSPPGRRRWRSRWWR